MNNFNLSEAKLNALLNIAGKKLNQDPRALMQSLKDGRLDEVVSGMDPAAKEKISGLVNNPEKLEALMADDKVKNLLSLLGNRK